MAENSTQTQKRDRHRESSASEVLIKTLVQAKNACGIPPAQIAFASVRTLLITIKDKVASKQEYVELGESCARVCQALDRGLDGKKMDDLSRSVLGAIEQLTSTVGEVEGKIIKQSQRNMISKAFHASEDKGAITAWNRDLDSILRVFNTELLINNHTILMDIHRGVQAVQGSTDGRHGTTKTSTPLGELPPPPPRVCFGREELIAQAVDLAQSLAPVALVGPGGIGKTSIALTVLHDDRIKERFGDNRRFIRCDQFPPSRTNFLGRLSAVIGAGSKNPEDLTPLRPFLSSRKILIVLDNAESILDPRGTGAREIYGVVEELSQFKTISVLITSRITVIPPYCKHMEIPTLSMDAARLILRGIYDRDEDLELMDKILQQLDFHPFSVTLLATVAQQNDWDNKRLWREWEKRQTGVLQTEQNDSLAATIELSLTSPTFEGLGPQARELLGVVAFYPQGIDENNFDWLFPSIPNKGTIFNKFRILSLTYRNNGYVTMLAPLRDYLYPRNPNSSLLCATKELYFSRLSVDVNPGNPGFEEARWIISEDVNVEHLLNVLTSDDINSDAVWKASTDFMRHLYWYKPRQIILRSKIEQLPDDHLLKPQCLFQLSRLFEKTGNFGEHKRLVTNALKLSRERGDDRLVAITLYTLSNANRLSRLIKEGIEQAKEALETCERLGMTTQKRASSIILADMLREDNQLDAAEEVVVRTINLSPGKGEEFHACKCHRLLGDIYRSKGEGEKAVHQYNKALEIASLFNWTHQQLWNHYSLARLFRDERKFEDAHTHVEQAKTLATDDAYTLARATEMHARIWYRQRRFEDAISEASRAIELCEKVGAMGLLKTSRDFLQDIQRAVNGEKPHLSW